MDETNEGLKRLEVSIPRCFALLVRAVNKRRLIMVIILVIFY